MDTAGWFILYITASTIVCFITWAITYYYCDYSKKQRCNHHFEKVLEVDVPGVHKAAYICKKCGLVKKVSL